MEMKSIRAALSHRPHNWLDGLKRALWPHPLFSAAGIGATILLPHFLKAAPAAALIGQAARGEWNDYRAGDDTLAKAIIDGVTQCLPTLLWFLL